jgi:hypothetical protein
MAHRVNGDHGFPILQKNGRGVTQVLTHLPVNDDLAVPLRSEIDPYERFNSRPA